MIRMNLVIALFVGLLVLAIEKPGLVVACNAANNNLGGDGCGSCPCSSDLSVQQFLQSTTNCSVRALASFSCNQPGTEDDREAKLQWPGTTIDKCGFGETQDCSGMSWFLGHHGTGAVIELGNGGNPPECPGSPPPTRLSFPLTVGGACGDCDIGGELFFWNILCDD